MRHDVKFLTNCVPFRDVQRENTHRHVYTRHQRTLSNTISYSHAHTRQACQWWNRSVGQLYKPGLCAVKEPCVWSRLITPHTQTPHLETVRWRLRSAMASLTNLCCFASLVGQCLLLFASNGQQLTVSLLSCNANQPVRYWEYSTLYMWTSIWWCITGSLSVVMMHSAHYAI